MPLSLLGTTSAAGFLAQGAASNGYAGWSVALVPSINGDTTADVLIGEPHSYFSPSGYSRQGAAWVVFGPSGGTRGKATLDTTSMTLADGFRVVGKPHQGLGASVAAGDFNGDGRGDLLVGSTDLADTYNGQGFVWFGTSGGPGSFTLNAYAYSGSGTPGGFFIDDGYSYTHYLSVTNIGDINGDGIDDFAVADADTLQVMVVFGNSGMATSPTVPRSVSSLNGTNGFLITTSNVTFGNRVLGIGDVNGDGHPDMLVQASYSSFHVIFGHSAGYTWSSTISLGTSISSPQGFTIYSTYLQSQGSVAAGDLNGDGVNDIVIGNPLLKWYDEASYSTFQAGGVFVIFGGSGLGASGPVDVYDMIYNGSGSTGFLVTGPVDNGWFGRSVAVGDLNGDGLQDLIIGTYYQGSGNYDGQVWVIFGPSGDTHLPSLTPVDDGEFYTGGL